MGYGYDLIKAETAHEALAKAPYDVGTIGVVTEVHCSWAGNGRWTVWPTFKVQAESSENISQVIDGD